MSLFSDNITSNPCGTLYEIAYKAASLSVCESKKHYIYLDINWLLTEIQCHLDIDQLRTFGMMEGTLPIIHVSKLPHWRWRWFTGKPVFHILIKVKISTFEPLVRILDIDL